MSIFKYRMQNILNMKLKLEEQAKIEFAAANRRVLEEEEKLLLFKNRKAALEKRAKELLHAPALDLQEIMLNRNGILKAENAIKKQQTILQAAKKDREEKRRRFMDERTDRKTHELLKENAFWEFMQEEKAAEGKEIDQLTSYTYGQKRTENNE